MRRNNVLRRIRSGPGLILAIFAALIAGAGIFAGAAAAAAHTTHALAVPQSAARAKPAPHVLPFAQGLRGARLTLPKGPRHVAVAWNVDGCDHDYGTVSQCVPWTVPASAGPGCQWLAVHGFGALKVTGRDRQNLDTNHDGVACDKGDAGT